MAFYTYFLPLIATQLILWNSELGCSSYSGTLTLPGVGWILRRTCHGEFSPAPRVSHCVWTAAALSLVIAVGHHLSKLQWCLGMKSENCRNVFWSLNPGKSSIWAPLWCAGTPPKETSLLKVSLSLALNSYRDGAATGSLGACSVSTTFIVQNFFLLPHLNSFRSRSPLSRQSLPLSEVPLQLL